jgi:uncharacterized protein (DUF1800 family)
MMGIWLFDLRIEAAIPHYPNACIKWNEQPDRYGMSPVKKILFLLFALIGFAVPMVQGQEIGLDGARHLLNRTGFSASDSDIREYALLTRDLAVNRLLKRVVTTALAAPPSWVDEPPLPPYKMSEMSDEERMLLRVRNLERGLELREWWYREMLTTPSPLSEKMTLFWHNHFATSLQKVRFAQLMYRQNVLLRRNALGNFATLLREVARDPAMVIYLDSAQNRRELPNENFAREVMELFTLGEGNYSEKDIREVARAFTGWSIDRTTGDFLFRPGIHDNGRKTVLGKSGDFDGNAVLDILLDHPRTAEFISRKLWKEFLSPAPDDEEIHRFARIFRNSRYDIKTLLRAMLTSDTFYASENRAALVKSPVELIVGTLKQFDLAPPTLRPFVIAGAFLGQNLLAPPNVKGWTGGEAWLNSTTLLGRRQFTERILGKEDDAEEFMTKRARHAEGSFRESRMLRRMEKGMGWMRADLENWSKQFKPEDREQAITRTLLAISPRNPPNFKPDDVAGLVRRLVTDPAYQLK